MTGSVTETVPGGSETALVLWKASRAVAARAVASIEHTGLCFSDFGVLEALLHKGPLPVSVLGRKQLLTSGSITTAVDRLVARALVQRTNDSGDRRIRLVELTAEGGRLIRPAYARHAADLDAVASVLTPEERSTLVALLRKLGLAAASVAEESETE